VHRTRTGGALWSVSTGDTGANNCKHDRSSYILGKVYKLLKPAIKRECLILYSRFPNFVRVLRNVALRFMLTVVCVCPYSKRRHAPLWLHAIISPRSFSSLFRALFLCRNCPSYRVLSALPFVGETGCCKQEAGAKDWVVERWNLVERQSDSRRRRCKQR
jgi:hypothetical protein